MHNWDSRDEAGGGHYTANEDYEDAQHEKFQDENTIQQQGVEHQGRVLREVHRSSIGKGVGDLERDQIRNK